MNVQTHIFRISDMRTDLVLIYSTGSSHYKMVRDWFFACAKLTNKYICSKSTVNTCRYVTFHIFLGNLRLNYKVTPTYTRDWCRYLSYQYLMVRSGPTTILTGNGGSKFDSGEGAWEMATTSKEGSRRETYPIPKRWGSDQMYLYRQQTVYLLEWA